MRTPQIRPLLIGSAALVLVASGLVATELVGGVAGATVNLDTVQYVQAANTSFTFVPGNGSNPTVQNLSFNGTCKTPAFSPSPLLVLSSQAYLNLVNGVPYTGPTTPENVGTNKDRTGVCETSPGWTVPENESLTFALGSNALTTGRTMTEAKVPVQLNGANQSGPNTATAVLVELNGTTQVGTQSVAVTGLSGTTVTVDSGIIASGFTSVELRVTDPNTKGSQQSDLSVVNTVSLSLLQLPQTITFTNTPPANPIVGNSYTVTATGGASGNPVAFTLDQSSVGCSLDPATGLVKLIGPAGTCVIDANQAGNGTYAPAPQVQQSVTFAKAPQTITFTSTPPSQAISGDKYTPTATGGASGNPVVLTIDQGSASVCSIDASNQVTFNTPGSCVIDANQAGNGSYLAAPQVQQTVTVYQTICGQQTINTQSTDGTNGQVSAAFTFLDYNGAPAPPGVCKTYSAFNASANNPVSGLSGNQTVTFASNPLATAHMTATISWATQSFCTPDGSNNTTQCPATYVSFDGGKTWQTQTYCTSAQAAGVEWCTTGRSYTITAQGTQITETWDGYGDPLFHHG